jgi:hypothetical protein
VIQNNFCVGPIALTNSPNAVVAGNVLVKGVDQSFFVDPAHWDYHLRSVSPAIGRAVQSPQADGIDLTAKFQYVHPAGEAARPADIPPDAGAFSFVAGEP